MPSQETTDPKAALRQLLQQADQAAQHDEHVLAPQLYEKAIAKALEINATSDAISILLTLSEFYRIHRLLGPAQECCLRTQKLAERSAPERLADVLLGLGRVYASQQKKQLAHTILQKAVRRKHDSGDKYGEADLALAAGFGYVELGDTVNAIALMTRAERLFRELGNTEMAIYALDSQALTYRSVNLFQKALEIAFAVLQEYKSRQHWRREAIEYDFIAGLYEMQGDPRRAAAAHREKTRILIQHQLEDMPFVLHQIGPRVVYDLEPGEAITLLNTFYERARQANNLDLAADALAKLASFYTHHKDWPKALEYNQRTLDLYRQLNLEDRQIGQLTNRGALYVAMDQLSEALPLFDEALQRAQKQHNLDMSASLAERIGRIHAHLGNPKTALEWYERGLQFHRTSGNRRGEVAVIDTICQQLAAEPSRTRPYLTSLLDVYESLADRIGIAQTHARLGDVERQLGQLGPAERHYQRSIAVAEQLRADAGEGMSGQQVLFENLSGPYTHYLTLLVQQNRAAEGLELVQKRKSRGLLELIVRGKVALSGPLSASERAEEKQYRDRCDQLAQAMVREAARNIPGSKARFEAAQRELAEAERHLSLYQDTLYARHPGLRRRRAALTVPVAELGKSLPAAAALLEFALLDDSHVAVFVVTRSSRGAVQVRCLRLPAPLPQLESHIRALRTACIDPKRPWKTAAQQLYTALFAPLEPLLAGRTQLLLCPDRALWDVPFAVLTDTTDRPLLARFTLSYASSATAWHAAQNNRPKPQAHQREQILVLANPQFDAERRFETGPSVAGQRPIIAPDRPITSPDRPITSPDRPITSPDRPITSPDRPITSPDRDLLWPRNTRLVDLPGTQREANALVRQFPQAVIYTRSRAQESVVKQQAHRFQWLHLASHAFVNDAAPLLSSVVLANPTPGSNEDGFLTAREIFELDLSGVELTVLSACNTARGATQDGEGLVGLTWALFAAGCPTQVLSQWAVDDASTATLMSHFYAGLAQKQGKSAALRRAALAVRSAPGRQHPYFWAPFVLLGKP